MKTINMLLRISPIFIALLSMAQLSSCQEIKEKNYHLTVEVKDSDGNPVPNVKAITGKLIPANEGVSMIAKSVTIESDASNAEGKIRLEYRSLPEPDGTLSVFGNGYYSSSGSFSWTFPDGQAGTNRSAEVQVVLKPVKNPIPMYAYDNKGGMERIVNIPEIGKRYGFDLMLAEALPPLGNGKIADFTFLIEGAYEKAGFYDMRLKILFASLHDGVVEFMTPQRTGMREPSMLGSQLLSAHIAPEKGYVSEITRTIRRKSLAQPPETNCDIHRNFYFRTRTKLDSNGKIISAHYGKIYGDFHFMGANSDWGYFASLVLATTYFNPTPNDRNVEFNPRRNSLPDGNVQRP